MYAVYDAKANVEICDENLPLVGSTSRTIGGSRRPLKLRVSSSATEIYTPAMNLWRVTPSSAGETAVRTVRRGGTLAANGYLLD